MTSSCAWPENRHIASTKYIVIRAGSSRFRFSIAGASEIEPGLGPWAATRGRTGQLYHHGGDVRELRRPAEWCSGGW